jgi:TIR domain
MSQIFISHSSHNNDYAVALRDWLAEHGWDDVFLDTDPRRGIAAGERWEAALHKAAQRCEAVLFLVSEAWLGSGWCLKEFHLAHRLNKRLFGVLIEDIPIARLPPELTGTWQLVPLVSGRDHIVLTVGLPTTQQEVHVTFSQEGLTRLKLGLERAGLDAKFFSWPPDADPKRPPYRGLKPLEAEDAGIFFGREAPTIEALDRLRGLKDAAPPRFLAILGASGAGKSSFLRAGLLPRLARDDRHFIPLPVLRPERAAISGETGLLRVLETALGEHGVAVPRADLRKAIDGGTASLRPLLTQLIDKAYAALVLDEAAARPPILVLSIDQSEELFLTDGAAEGANLLALLKDLLAEDSPGLLVLATIRSDSYERLQTAKALDGVTLQPLNLPPMPRGAYQTIVEGPAQRLKDTDRPLIIEPALVQALLADIEEGGGRDALPLLAFTLERLYLEYGVRGRLTLADYDALGRIRGSIESAVERALKAADKVSSIPKDRAMRLALLRRGLIPAIASVDLETGSPRRRVAQVRDSGGDIVADSVVLATLEGVRRASHDWNAEKRKEDWLTHGGSRLKEAEALEQREDMALHLDEI